MTPYHTILLLIILTTQSGCLAVAAAGGAAGGIFVANDERTIGEITDDTVLTATIKSLLLKDKEVGGLQIDVDVHKKVVKLHGLVKTEAEIKRAIELANEPAGVKRVISNLKVIEVPIKDRS